MFASSQQASEDVGKNGFHLDHNNAKINEEFIETLPSECQSTFNNGSGKKPMHCKAHKNDFGLQYKELSQSVNASLHQQYPR
jgi:hypothetical protein